MSQVPVSPTRSLDLLFLIRALVKYQASDLHLRPARPPLFRVHGSIVAAKMAELKAEEVLQIFQPYLNKRHTEKLENERQVDFSVALGEYGRFRVNLFFQRGNLSATGQILE